MSTSYQDIWAGSEDNLRVALLAEDQSAAHRQARMVGTDGEDDDRPPRLLSVDSGIATITISGPLVNSDSPYLEYYGVTAYQEIREAILAAANDPEVKQVLLSLDSGGGAVTGCDDTAKLIRLINDKVKPVTTYADTMCSAAYWLGCSAGNVYATKSSLVGSIGIISTFKEYSEQNKAEGVTVTVLRAGKHKALANQNEKLSAEARAQIQKLLDASYTVFVEHVTAMRGGTYEMNDKTRADGQEFIGQAAVDVGLVDQTTTFDALITKLKAKIVASEQKSIDNQRNGSNRLYGSTTSDPVKAENDPSASMQMSTRTTSPGDSQMAKKALTEADIVALAAGAQADHELLAETQTLEGANDGLQETSEKAVEGVIDTSASTELAVKPEVATIDATVQLLNSQLKEKDAALLEAGIKLASLQSFKDQYEAVLQPLKDIVGRSAHIMHVAQGGATRDFASMQPADLVAEHQRLAVGFSRFPVGGVAAVASEPSTEKRGAQVISNMTQAQINAVRGTN